MKRAGRQLLSLLLSLTLLCGLCVPSAFAVNGEYSDTQGHWAESSIERWSGYGVIQGNNGSFNPDGSLTRAQMAVILARLLALPEVNSAGFDDVNDGDWFAEAVNSCSAAGIMQGSGGKAMPNAPITREQTVTMLCRALGIAPAENADLSAYTDAAEVSNYAKGSIAAMLQAGIVKGTGSNILSPKANITRAAFATILDRAIGTYAAQTGATVDVANNSGLILIAAKNVTVKNAPKGASVIVAQSATGATVNGKAVAAGSSGTATEQEKPASGGSSGGSGGSSGGSSSPSVSNLTVSEAKTVTGGTYNNVTIAATVADGTVTLDGVTVKGTLTVQGGGSHSINLMACTVQGKVVLDKASGEAPRLNLTNTPVGAVEIAKPAILEADATSAISAVTAKANVEVKGDNTAVAAITVPADVTAPVALKVTAGSVGTVAAKGETTVSGAGSVSTVVAEATVNVASDTVGKVEVPATAGAGVTVAVTGSAAIEVEINSTNGAAITGSNVAVSTTLDTLPPVTVGGVTQTHLHKWNDGEVTRAATCKQAGLKTYTCTETGCTDPIATKMEEISILPHTVVADPAVAATCTAVGKTAGSHCSVCDTVLVEQTEIPALGHKWGEWQISDNQNHTRVCDNDPTHVETEAHAEVVDAAVAATCTTSGKTEGKHCSVCNAVITAQTEVPALTHDFTGEYCSDADGHWHKCSRDDVTDEKTAHTYNTTNCAEAATCTVCGYEKTAGQHSYGEFEITQEATCTAAGSKKAVCSVCGDILTKAISALGHNYADEFTVDTPATCAAVGSKSKHCSRCDSKTEVTEISMTTHTYGAWSKVDDTNHKHTCSACQTEETAAHTWNAGVITAEPTETTEGVKTYTCTACGATKIEVLPVVSASKIELVQSDNSIKANWTGFDYPSYYFEIADSSGNKAMSGWANEGESETGELGLYLPRIETGTAVYSFVLYSATAEYKIGNEIGRLNNCIEVTAAGTPVDYNIAFNSPEVGKHTVTWVGSQPDGVWHIRTWYRDGVIGGTGCGSISPTRTESEELNDGDMFDLRILTAYTLDGQTLKATMTPSSTKTYTEACTLSTPELKTDGNRVWLEAAVSGTLPADAEIGIWNEQQTGTTPRLTLGQDSSYFDLTGNVLKCYLDVILANQTFTDTRLALSIVGTENKTAYTSKTLVCGTSENDMTELAITKTSDTTISIAKTDDSAFAANCVYGCVVTIPDNSGIHSLYYSSTAGNTMTFTDYNGYLTTATKATIWCAIPTDGDTTITVNHTIYPETDITA